MMKKHNIEPVVTILDHESGRESPDYWLSKTPDERINTVLYLRDQYIVSLGFAYPPSVEPVVNIK